jgi:aldose 1-epimerase
MKTNCLTTASLIVLAFPLLAFAQYKVERDGDVIHLIDSQRQTAVAINSTGNHVFEMTVKGQNIIYSLQGGGAGIPFLAPWANRLDEQAFYANGKKYSFNMSLGNVKGATPMHGFLSQAPWQVVELKADRNAAWLKSRLDFYKHPEWMAQFPFAHTIEMTQRLHDGVLEVHTRIDNLSTEPMPVAIGFHPYFRLTDSTRDEWTISVGAKSHYLLQPNKIPTGDTEAITRQFPDPTAARLKNYDLDDAYGDLTRDKDGKATFSVSGKQQRVTVQFGPKYQVAVIFSPDPTIPRPNNPNPPRDPNFVCFEPMAAVTDAMNLQQAGKYSALESIAPGGTWQESFWIIPSGF